MLGLWIVRDGAGQALLARVQGDVYVLAFSSAVRAMRARELLGAEGVPFLIVAANVVGVVRDARADGARGFIVDYDPEAAVFKSAHGLPSAESTLASAAR
ncbi:MAG: hypothetical protein JWN44_2010 [Myxococcales bacterium]|nr:hypothetical protein [Myxococcales bacterium]